MNYYILPKINNTVIVNPIDSKNYYKAFRIEDAQIQHSVDDRRIRQIINPYISQSLYKYYNQIRTFGLNEIDDETYEELVKIVNPYEYIFSKVPGSKFSVSKLKPKTNMFYDFLEVCTTLDISNPTSMKTLHITPNHCDTIDCFEMMRENYNDDVMGFNEIKDETIKLIGDIKFDFLFFETRKDNLNEYFISLIEVLMIILRNQIFGGNCIIRIHEVFHKPIVDILYMLSSLYERVFILKPTTSNITTFDKYIVCKNFRKKEKDIHLKINYFRLFVFINKSACKQSKQILSILDYDIPYYYKMKIDDMNIIFGQQLLEAFDLILNISKNKNKEEKIETLKKTNIQKSVTWCERHKIPCNKFSEKINIFLTNIVNY